MSTSVFAWGIGFAATDAGGACVEASYLRLGLSSFGGAAPAISPLLGAEEEQVLWPDKKQRRALAKVTGLPELDAAREKSVVVCLLRQDAPLKTAAGAYLKLHLLSHRLCRPNHINLENLFSVLPNLAWTNEGPVPLEELPARRRAARAQGGYLKVFSVDKFPPMADYVVPDGVRIADTARVRLGAWIGEGTTIMHEGFINFNAGTEGPNMVEGRISAGVVVGAGSDLGGGASTMGTLSGGGKVLISVGRHCLIGANAGTGIPLGDNCTIEAGLYITAGTVVQTPQGTRKARELAGKPDLLFRRNSLSGAVECLPNPRPVELNRQLHDNAPKSNDD